MLRQVLSHFALKAFCLCLTIGSSALCFAQSQKESFTNHSEQVQLIRNHFNLLKNTKKMKEPTLDLDFKKQQEKLRQNLTPKSGGLSDGGGNAIGGVLFDHYENFGSFAMPAQHIVNWNQELHELILKANTLVPRMGEYTERGLGDELVLAIRSKKWLLETKDLTGKSCVNDSMIQAINQQVVGCQNFYEVRISADWLLNVADDKNQADLIAHEAILSWLRDSDKTSSKEDLEFKVRQIIRLLSEKLESEEFVQQLQKLIPNGKFYTSEEGVFEQTIPQRQREIKNNFCLKNSADDHAQVLAMYRDYPKSYNTLQKAFGPYLTVMNLSKKVQSIKQAGLDTTNDEQKLKEKQREFCGDRPQRLPDVSQLKFKPELLSKQCRESVEEAFESYIDILNKAKAGLFGKESGEFLLAGADTVALTSSYLCSGLKGIELQNTTFWPFMTEARGRALMKEVELQAIKYYVILKENYESKN